VKAPKKQFLPDEMKVLLNVEFMELENERLSCHEALSLAKSDVDSAEVWATKIISFPSLECLFTLAFHS
jgi:hypothetical protein